MTEPDYPYVQGLIINTATLAESQLEQSAEYISLFINGNNIEFMSFKEESATSTLRDNSYTWGVISHPLKVISAYA